MSSDAPILWTVGHSNRAFEDLRRLLESARIEVLADVRRFPGSRRHPHFAQRALATALPQVGVRYLHFEALGGHREPVADSPNDALSEPAFRGYADHMRTPEFRSALERLLALAREHRTAVLCAEARWQDCHRRYLSDRLVTAGARVVHLVPGTDPEPHTLHPAARFVSGDLIYRRPRQLEFGS
jgi:uncharacterized protein (DUF488 family)